MTSNGEKLLGINGVELCVETFGSPSAPAILLIDGAAASMLWWDAGLCEQIAANGRFVIRYDNRDTGRSTSYPPGQPGYSVADMAEDAVGILDALGIERAHVVCRSFSGAIGLILGVDHSDRVASLTFVSTTTGDEGLPSPTAEFLSHVTAAPDTGDLPAVVDYIVDAAKVESGRYFDEAATRALVERDVARARNIASTLVNHFAAESRPPVGGGFADVTAPTLVVHGDRDPIFPLPHGKALRDAIPRAELLTLEGAGHDLPRPVWNVFVAALVSHTAGRS